MIVYRLYFPKEMREGGEKVDILVAKKKHIQLTEAQAVEYIAHIIIFSFHCPGRHHQSITATLSFIVQFLKTMNWGGVNRGGMR